MRLTPAGFSSALAFLTRLPAPSGPFRLDQGLVWFPVIGLLLGGILAALDFGLRALAAPSLLASTILVLALLALTGALHADGLVDTWDAVFAHATPERRLEIMRDPHVGTFGVVGLLGVLLLKIAAVDSVPEKWQTWALVLAPTLGRWAIVLLAVAFPYGRSEGLGAPLKAGATRFALVVASIVAFGACAAAWPLGPSLALLAVLTALLLGHWFMRLVPGQTGDTYGATCEVVETVALVAAALLAYALG